MKRQSPRTETGDDRETLPGLQVSVILPTRCEAENLRVLVPQIAAALRTAGLRGEIVVVDDNSPDDTPAACAALQAEYPLRLLVRAGERGLASAVLRGIEASTGALVVVMDADLSHPADQVPQLVDRLLHDEADFVIGSRYVPGGSTYQGWGLFRWLNSQIATVLARPLTAAHDPLAGFFALRRSTFAAAAPLNPIGYKIGLELLVKCGCRRVAEVPIAFGSRLHGESKLSLRQQLDYLRHLKLLYEFKFGHAARLGQFTLVGATGSLVDLFAFAALRGVLPLPGARAAAIAVAMTWNYLLNRRVTFAGPRRRGPAAQYGLFCLACLSGAVLNWGVSLTLIEGLQLGARSALAAAALGIASGALANYFLAARLVFPPIDKEVQTNSPNRRGPASSV